MTEDLEEKLNNHTLAENKPVKINKAVSFNAIKSAAFEIFHAESDKHIVLEKLSTLFVVDPTLVRKKREVSRGKITDTCSLNFQKRKRKHVF